MKRIWIFLTGGAVALGLVNAIVALWITHLLVTPRLVAQLVLAPFVAPFLLPYELAVGRLSAAAFGFWIIVFGIGGEAAMLTFPRRIA